MFLMAGLSLSVLPSGLAMGTPHSVWDAFFRWDSGWYWNILYHGYSFDPHQQSSVGFFPLYPALIWLLSLGRTIDPKMVGFALSNAALCLACGYIWRLTMRRWKSQPTADLAVVLVLCGPVSFFFSIPYSEGLFLLATAGCLDAAERKRWWEAGLWGFAAALTRSVGFVLVLPLLLHFITPWKSKRDWRQLGWAFLPVAGAALFVGYLWIAFGDAEAYFKVQRHWGRQLAWPWLAFETGMHNNGLAPFYRILFSGAAIFAAVMLPLALVMRAPLSWVALVVVWPVLFTSSLLLDSLPRYLSIVVPYYPIVAAACGRWPVLTWPLILWLNLLQMLCLALFVNGYWFV